MNKNINNSIQKISALTWKPHDPQKLILKSAKIYRFITLICGRRFGKTLLVVNKLLRDFWENPGIYVYIAPQRNQAKRIAWQMFKDYFPDQFKIKNWKNESELYLENLKGGKIQLLGADDPDSLRGDKRKGVILDEYADMNPYTFDAIEPSLGDEKGYCWFVGTPKGKDHFYARFIRDDIYFDSVFAKEYEIIYQKILEVDRNYKSYKFKTEDNPYFPKESIEQARKNLTLEYFRQEYEASFENYTGLIYREFLEFKNELILEPIIRQNIVIGCKKKREIIKNNKLEIIIDEIIFKDYWHYYSGLDTGRINACLFLSIDEEGNEYWYEELYLIDTLVEENAEKIKNKMTKRNFLANTIDSASQVKNEYRARGINFTDSQKDVLGSIEMMRGKMKNRKMFILSNCKAFINELSNRKWSENKTQTINGKRKPIPEPGNDHCCNAAEYINLTFLKYPQKIITPFIKNYEKSLESLVINQEISNWKEKG